MEIMHALAKYLVRLKRPRGFTLTELLVVIGVIAILLAILLTVLHSAYRAVRSLRG